MQGCYHVIARNTLEDLVVQEKALFGQIFALRDDVPEFHGRRVYLLGRDHHGWFSRTGHILLGKGGLEFGSPLLPLSEADGDGHRCEGNHRVNQRRAKSTLHEK